VTQTQRLSLTAATILIHVRSAVLLRLRGLSEAAQARAASKLLSRVCKGRPLAARAGRATKLDAPLILLRGGGAA
jgi:hypothetical protein